MTNNIHTKNNQNRSVQLIVFLGFIFGFSVALLTYIASSYYKQVVGGDNVGIFLISKSPVDNTILQRKEIIV